MVINLHCHMHQLCLGCFLHCISSLDSALQSNNKKFTPSLKFSLYSVIRVAKRITRQSVLKHLPVIQLITLLPSNGGYIISSIDFCSLYFTPAINTVHDMLIILRSDQM